GLTVAFRSSDNPTHYPLVLSAVPGQELQIHLDHDAARFDPANIDRIAGHVEQILREMTGAPSRRLSEIGLLTDAEREQVIVEWNRTEAPFSSDACIHQLFEAHADRAPHAVALVDLCGPAPGSPGNALTYGELDARANQVAHHLLRLGVGPDMRVGLCLSRGADLIVGLLGILKAGGAFVVLDPEHPRRRLQFLMEDTGVSVLLTAGSLLSTLPETAARLVDFERGFEDEPAHRPQSDVGPNHLVYVLYTSGSTGDPNGVLIEHRGLVNTIDAAIRILETGPDTRFSHVLSFNFDGAIFNLFCTLCAGGAVYLAPRDGEFLGQGLIERMERDAITHTLLPPTMLAALPEAELPALRTLAVAGESCSADLVTRWGRTRRFINMYGPTEASILATSTRCVPDGTTPSIGRPIENLQAYIVDRRGRLVPPGVTGELWLGGVGVARGYLNRPELTARKFVDNPFLNIGGEGKPPASSAPGPSGKLYRTGDLVRYRVGGDSGPPELEFIGRADTQVKIRGYRIELSEIEIALRASSLVRDAVVTVRDGAAEQGTPRRLVAYVTPAIPAEAAEGELSAALRRELRQALPPHLVPSAIVVLARLPLTVNGKVDLRALPPPEASRDTPAEAAEPRTFAERTLAEIWRTVLGLPAVGIHDNFFEVGGDSILSVLIASKAQASGLPLRANQLFEHPTIAELALAAGEAAAGPYAADQGLADGPVPLTPIQRWFLEQELPSPSHFNQGFFIETPPDLDLDLLRRAFSHLQDHHDALRLRFTRRAVDGAHAPWIQEHVAPPGELAFEVLDLSPLSPGEQRASMQQSAARLQASLDISAGPLMRIAVFRLGGAEPGRMLWVIHHLIVDAVSWSILLLDLGTVYQQLAAGQAVKLPAKTTSFKRWAERLVEHARRATFEEERAITALAPPVSLPVDHPAGRNSKASAAEIRVRLSKEETAKLLEGAHRPNHVGVQDLLLAALAQVVSRFTGSPDVWIDLEGHGREPLFDDIDLSRTVGWFTTLFPVRLRLPSDEPSEVLAAIKEQLRAVPRHGIGYGLLRYLHEDGQKLLWPKPLISFNHLGRFRSEIDSPLGLRFVRENLGPFEAAQGTRSHVLAMNSLVADDCLEISLGYSRDLHDDATIERLAGELVATVRSLVHHGHGLSPLLLPIRLPIRTSGARPPVFCVGGFGADASYLHSLGPSLGADQPFYGIQPIDLREEMPELDSMEVLGERLADIIQQVQPAGPYTLSGHSGGACLALA
ncbi:MAG TPA: amino acid adenylation domain-containing protein, partial [Candidatus Nanopelagicales bacterium]|nr:amino acid adenylation domain-containing protein [Candidatus Nanopelagicales bacterium]